MAEIPSIAIQTRQLVHRYGDRWILRDLTLELPRGALCALLGPNGVGKSTLLRVLAGVQTPTAGTICPQGCLGFVPQEVHPALPLSVLEMVLLGRSGQVSLFGTPRREDYVAARQALEQVHAGHLIERMFASLSGGERQLVLMARALVRQADILLLDEPMAAMDWHNQGMILRLLARLSRGGMTVVFSTHAPQHALEFASHALLLFGEGDFAFGTPNDVMHEQALSRLYRLSVRRIHLNELPQSGTAVPVFSHSFRSCEKP